MEKEKTFGYYDQVPEGSELTPCQQDVEAGVITVDQVPFLYRNLTVYEVAYQAADDEEKKKNVNDLINQDIEKYKNGINKDYLMADELYSIYIRHNREQIEKDKEKYYASMACKRDLLNGVIKIHDVPFEFRTRSHYSYALRNTLEGRRKDDYSAKQERKLIAFQVQSDIIRSRMEHRKDLEAEFMAAEESCFFTDWETGEFVSLL